MLITRPSKLSSNSGFTLIEALVVVIMVAILMAIASPGWLAFANRQRVNVVRDAALQTLRTAQTQAQQRRATHTITVRNDAGNPALEISLGPVDSDGNVASGNLVSLGNDRLPDGFIEISGFTLQSGSWVARDTISFDYQGALVNGRAYKIEVQPTVGGEVRCVIITTLLGSMQTFNGSEACSLTTFE